jgi:hypothetical protein
MKYLAFGAIVAVNLAVAGLAQDMSAIPDSDVPIEDRGKSAAEISYATLVDCAGYYAYIMTTKEDGGAERKTASDRMDFFSDAATSRYPENNEETVLLAMLDTNFNWLMMPDETRPEQLSAKEIYCRNLGDIANGTAG